MNIKATYIVFSIVFASAIYFSCTSFEAKRNEVNAVYKDSILIQLGRYLFYDRRLSVNETKACATCHAQEFSFTDGYKKSVGALGDNHQRNARPLINLVYNKYFTAADSSIKTLLQQMQKPMFNQHPVEMGIANNEEIIVNRIRKDVLYQKLFAQVFGNGADSISINNIQKAIEAFEKTIFSFDSKYDKFIAGDSTILNTNEKKGLQLFFSHELKCNSCHSGKTFAEPNFEIDAGFYNNIGLYNVNNSYPIEDEGLYSFTKNKKDKGKFRTPTLRNLAFTAPYFHDGSALTLQEVVDVYEHGGRNITYGLVKGDGRKNVNKSKLITGFQLTLTDKNNLISFLLSLSDSTTGTNKNYSNPFIGDETKK